MPSILLISVRSEPALASAVDLRIFLAGFEAGEEYSRVARPLDEGIPESQNARVKTNCQDHP